MNATQTMPRRAAAVPTPWLRCWLEGAGAAILLTPGLMWAELSRTHIFPYHRLMPQNTINRALAIDLVLLSFLCMLAVRGLEKLVAWYGSGSTRTRRNIAALVWAPWFGFLAARGVQGLIVVELLSWQQISDRRAFFLVANLLIILWIVSGRWYAAAVRGLRVGFLLLGFCIIWMLPVLVKMSLTHQPYDQVRLRKPMPIPAHPHRRIVWLLFDGMSYEQVFVHRWPDLQMPNFDKLRAQSTTFSDVQPDGKFTEDVIPSILLGQPIEDVRATPGGWLLYQTAKGAPWERFDGRQTLFADAQRAGWTTGAIGWFNPYCRILPQQLDFCWMVLPPPPDHLSGRKSTLANVVAPLMANWKRATGQSTQTHQTDLESLDQLVQDEGLDLCFVHIPIPHPPGRWNRKTNKPGPGSYIDNLAESDQVLGRLLGDIAQSNSAEQTSVIVSSDHSWRTWLWRDTFGWTAEDEAASHHGQFDPRPMLMVRFPGDNQAETLNGPVPLLGMHNLVESMVAGHIENRKQLENWAAQQRQSATAP